MTTQNRFFDDMSKLMTNAMGVAQAPAARPRRP